MASLTLVSASPVSTSQFVSPSARTELQGELGLDLHEIAKTMQLRFNDVKEKAFKLAQDDDLTLCVISAYNDNNRLVESAILDVDNAKLLVTQLGGKLSIAYCRHLIQCEKRLQSLEIGLDNILANPLMFANMLMKLHNERLSSSNLASENEQLKLKLGEAETWKVAIGWKNVYPEFEQFKDISLGMQLSKLSREMGIEFRKVDHAVYGAVNCYHHSVAEELRKRIIKQA